MGLQNAAVASTTGLAVRTTHLTGPATDLGIHLGAALFATGQERRAAFKGATLRGGKILSFMVGAGLSVPLANWAGYLSLPVPRRIRTRCVSPQLHPSMESQRLPLQPRHLYRRNGMALYAVNHFHVALRSLRRVAFALG